MKADPHGVEVLSDDEIAGIPDRHVRQPPSALRSAVEWVAVIGGALVVALLIKTFLFQAFYIPSDSMVPTLQVGDRVLVNKLSYDLHDVRRGDLVVFSRPEGTPGSADDLIKRVVGLPGDEIALVGEDITINGKILVEPYLPDSVVTCCLTTIAVPDDHVFVMGDNRGDSYDSRRFGPIPVSSIVGHAFLRVWPPSRIGTLWSALDVDQSLATASPGWWISWIAAIIRSTWSL